MPFVWAVLLTLVLAAPGALTLFAWGYAMLPLSHLAALVASVLILAAIGRAIRRRGGRPARAGLTVGAAAGALGAVGTQVLMHTPQATAAFATSLAPHGVPAAAATTLLHLHAMLGAALIAASAAAQYGVVGWIAGWWGGRAARRVRPDRVHAGGAPEPEPGGSP